MQHLQVCRKHRQQHLQVSKRCPRRQVARGRSRSSSKEMTFLCCWDHEKLKACCETQQSLRTLRCQLSEMARKLRRLKRQRFSRSHHPGKGKEQARATTSMEPARRWAGARWSSRKKRVTCNANAKTARGGVSGIGLEKHMRLKRRMGSQGSQRITYQRMQLHRCFVG